MTSPADEPVLPEPDERAVALGIADEEQFAAYLAQRQADFDLDPTGYFVKVWGYDEHDEEVEITDWADVDFEALKAIDRMLRAARDQRTVR